MVMYSASRRLTPDEGAETLGKVYDSYFNRSFAHFCSHFPTPNKPDESGFASGVLKDNFLYFAHPLFTLYYKYGNVAVKKYFAKESKTNESGFAIFGRIVLTNGYIMCLAICMMNLTIFGE